MDKPTPGGTIELDDLFYRELRGKTVTEDQQHILEWAERRLKPAILALLASSTVEARIDQMAYVNQRLIGKNTSGDRVFYDKDAVIAENRLLDRQRVIFNAMMAELALKPDHPAPEGGEDE